MNTTRFLRPFARAAFRAPTAVRPAVMARPALASQQQKKTPEVGAQQMVHRAPLYCAAQTVLTNADHPQVGYAPADPLLLRQRDHRGLRPPPHPHLHLLQVHPAPAPPPFRRPPVHQQVVNGNQTEGDTEVEMCTNSRHVLIDNGMA